MANFTITTQKPNSSELNASRPKTAGKVMEDAFDSLMTHKEAAPARSISDNDSKKHSQEQRHQHSRDQDVKKSRDQHLAQARNLAAQTARMATQAIHHQPAQPLAMTPEQLIQRRSQDGKSDQQQSQQEKEAEVQEIQEIQETEEAATTMIDSVSGDLVVDVDQADEELGSVFDDLDLMSADGPAPAEFGDESSLYDMMASSSSGGRSQGRSPRESAPLQAALALPGEFAEQLDQVTGAPVQSAEEAQLLAAAMDKTTGHYPDGSVGKALQEGKLSQEALHKLFGQWKLQRDGQNQRHHNAHHGRAIPTHLVKPQGHIIPQFEGEALRDQQMQDDGESSETTLMRSDSLEKIYEYIRERMVESVWIAKAPHALAEGVIVNLKGDLVGESRFHIQKVQDRIEISFYIDSDQFMGMAQNFETTLAETIRNKCDVGEVNIRYHRLAGSSEGSAGSGNRSMPKISEADDFDGGDDDLWG